MADLIKNEIDAEMEKLGAWLEKHETLIGLRCIKLILETAEPEKSLLIPLLIADRGEIDGSDLVCDSES